MHACHSGHLNTDFLCARDCLNYNVRVLKYLIIIWKRIFMHKITSDNQQLKDGFKELKGA